MLKVLIVDDDAINRTAIATMIDWEEIDCKVVYEAEEGMSALTFMEKNAVDLVITDMKMPIMDGLQLIKELRKKDYQGGIVVVSSYDEFDMVRKAFVLGIHDYYLKSELKPELFYDFIEKVRRTTPICEDKEEVISKEIEEIQERSTFETDMLGVTTFEESKYTDYYILMLQIDDIYEVQKRFVNIRKELFGSIYEILKQIPKVNNHCRLMNYGETRILIYLENQTSLQAVTSLAERMVLVLKNYLNINISVGVSQKGKDGRNIVDCIKQVVELTTLRYILPNQKIYTVEDSEKYQLSNVFQQSAISEAIIDGLKKIDEDKIINVVNTLSQGESMQDIEQLKLKVLHLIIIESLYLEDIGDCIWNAFLEKVYYVEKLNRLLTSVDVVIWFKNFNRWIMNYLQQRYGDNQENSAMKRVQTYLAEHYMDKNLTLGHVAEIMELNEQYFCSKFRREMGVSFVEYLTNLRIEHAMDLFNNTNMKIYEVCDSVGYNNVEHFSRVFRKKVGVTPREYKS